MRKGSVSPVPAPSSRPEWYRGVMSGKQFKSDSPTIEEIRRKKKPLTTKVEISMDPELTRDMVALEAKIERAEAKLGTAGLRGRSLADLPDVEQLETDLAALWDRARDESAIVEFHFKDPGRKRYDDLVTENPPTDEQKQEWKDGGGDGVLAYNPETFVPGLISLCASNPVMTIDQANEVCDEWSTGDVTKLFNGALGVCVGVAPVPKSQPSRNGTDEISSSKPSSTSVSA